MCYSQGLGSSSGTSTDLTCGVEEIGRAVHRAQLDVGVISALHSPRVAVTVMG